MGRSRSVWIGVVLGVSSGCSGGEDITETPGTPGQETPTPSTGETFANPPELEPNEDGVYELHFRPGEVELDGERYCLRTYNGLVPAPTIRIPPGSDRRIRVNLYNEFLREDWKEVSGMEGFEHPTCHDFNLTNLHFHGGHVQPNFATEDTSDPCIGDGCGEGDRYHGDHVLIRVDQGQMAQYRWDIDEDGIHHEGTNWYHPHIHGATAIQVVNGVAGVLIVEGATDQIPSVAATRERVMIINEIPVNHEYTTPLTEGESCSEMNLSIDNFLSVTEGMPMFVNGMKRPRLVSAPGQVERWRITYAGTPDEMGMELHVGDDSQCESYSPEKIIFTQYARDGITMPAFYQNDDIWVSPGYRVDSFVQMPETPQTLCLVGTRTHDLAGTVLAIVDVRDDVGLPTTTDMPTEEEVVAVAPPVAWTGLMDGETKTISCETVDTIHQRVGLLMPPVPIMPGEQQSYGGTCEHSDHEEAIDPDAPVCECPAPNINCRNFDTRRAWGYRSDRVVTVGTSEKWEVVALDGHPFHIHINPFVVCPNNSNKEPNFAHWRDTFWVQVEDGPREILMNFRAFTGQTVNHCHKLNHEDEGMMELVEICDPTDTECLCQGTDESGQCISQAGCQADDYQCQFAAIVTESYPLPPPPTPELCSQ